jgi:hypothetical protein
VRLLSLIGGPLLVLGALTRADGQSPCLPADSDATQVADLVKDLITSTDPDDVALRTAIGLTNVNISQVSILTSGTDCTKARQDGGRRISGTHTLSFPPGPVPPDVAAEIITLTGTWTATRQ